MFHIQASHSPVDDSWGQPGPLPLPGRDRNTHCQRCVVVRVTRGKQTWRESDDVDGDEEPSPNRSARAQVCCCLFWGGKEEQKMKEKQLAKLIYLCPAPSPGESSG